MTDVFDSLAESTGFPADQLRYLVCLILLVPLSFGFRMLPSAAMKHGFSIVVGLLMCHFTLGAWSWLHSLGTSTICYVIMSVVPQAYARNVVFTFMLGHLSASHIYRMLTDWMGWSLDFTGPQMILVIKMTMLAYNYFDGNRPAEIQQTMRPYQKEHKIKQLPGLLEFYGYVYFFPSFLAGPAYEFSDYQKLISGSIFEGDKEAQNSFPVMPILMTNLKAIAVFPVVMISSTMFPLSFLTTPLFEALPLWEKLLRVWLHVALARWKYFLAWYLAEAGFIACGAGYNGKDKKGNRLWDRATNSYPLRVEFPENLRQCVESWNMVTQTWLKNYIYLRVADKGYSAGMCSLFTYSVSAFWHGFYPGYYMTFIFSGVVTEVAKTCRRKLRPLFMKQDGVTPQSYKLVYDIMGTLSAAFIINYAGTAFLFLALPPSVAVYNQIYWLGHVAVFILAAALSQMRTPKNQPTRPKST